MRGEIVGWDTLAVMLLLLAVAFSTLRPRKADPVETPFIIDNGSP